jgi:eukaryotic-like serine/threonine-protein kinase
VCFRNNSLETPIAKITMSLLGRTIGNYVLEFLLGEGGMGAVYLARHPLIGKRVAIKVMKARLASDDGMAARFFSEARAVNEIRHPNIVDIIDFGHADSLLYFTMEHLEGESLAERLATSGFTNTEARHIAHQCCSALDASHRHDIIHRDLKPQNIFLCRRGADTNYVKVLDFGLAKMARGEGGYKTGQGEIFGTPDYMSPEQCQGASLADARSDVYSLGVVLYEMLTRRTPFACDTVGETMIAHITRTPLPPSQLNPAVSPALDAVVMRALEKDRGKRFQTMSEFAAALREPESHLTAQPDRINTKTPVGPTRQLERPSRAASPAVTMRVAPPARGRRWRLAAWALTAAGLALLIGATTGNWKLSCTSVAAQRPKPLLTSMSPPPPSAPVAAPRFPVDVTPSIQSSPARSQKKRATRLVAGKNLRSHAKAKAVAAPPTRARRRPTAGVAASPPERPHVAPTPRKVDVDEEMKVLVPRSLVDAPTPTAPDLRADAAVTECP